MTDQPNICEKCGTPWEQHEDGSYYTVCDNCLRVSIRDNDRPREYMKASFDFYTAKRGYSPEVVPQIIKFLKIWVNDEGEKITAPILMLRGNTNTGKTGAIWAIKTWIAMNAIDPFIGGHFLRCPDFINKLTEKEWGEKGIYRDVIYKKRMLFLDDLGLERHSIATSNQIVDLIDYRSVHDLPTVITTNYTGEDILKNYDPRLLSRIWAGVVIVMKGTADRLERGIILNEKEKSK